MNIPITLQSFFLYHVATFALLFSLLSRIVLNLLRVNLKIYVCVCMYVCICMCVYHVSLVQNTVLPYLFPKNKGSLLDNHSTVSKTRAFNIDTVISSAAHISFCHLSQ